MGIKAPHVGWALVFLFAGSLVWTGWYAGQRAMRGEMDSLKAGIYIDSVRRSDSAQQAWHDRMCRARGANC